MTAYDKKPTDGIKQKAADINDKAKRLGRSAARQSRTTASDTVSSVRTRSQGVWGFLKRLFGGGDK